VSPAPLGAGQLQARKALGRELDFLRGKAKISQREIGQRLNLSQALVSRVINGLADLSTEELVRWARLTRADEKLDELLQLHEQAARAGAEQIPAGSIAMAFSYTLVRPGGGSPYLAVVFNGAELLVPYPDPALVAEHRLVMERIISDAAVNNPGTGAGTGVGSEAER
jgi:transcriptional regulator with XRE-family HTH domain